MSREFAQAVWACYKADGTDLKEILSLPVQRALVQSMGTDRARAVPERIDDDED